MVDISIPFSWQEVPTSTSSHGFPEAQATTASPFLLVRGQQGGDNPGGHHSTPRAGSHSPGSLMKGDFAEESSAGSSSNSAKQRAVLKPGLSSRHHSLFSSGIAA